MTYYKVPPKFDGRAVIGKGLYSGTPKRFLIENELYTEKECDKYGISLNGLEVVNVSRKRIYWFFGARFEMED